jgi:hypothetical protein
MVKLNKKIVVLTSLVVIASFLFSFTVVAAKPRWINTLELEYYKDAVGPYDVDGALTPGFMLYYDETVGYYSLDVKVIDPVPPEGEYEFYLKTAPKGPYFKYWEERGVYEGCEGIWEPTMWLIINGELPMFILSSDGIQCDLIDGLYREALSTDIPLRINGDYFVGTYHFLGDVDGERTMIKLFFR